jgi:hypothetical protein
MENKPIEKLNISDTLITKINSVCFNKIRQSISDNSKKQENIFKLSDNTIKHFLNFLDRNHIALNRLNNLTNIIKPNNEPKADNNEPKVDVEPKENEKLEVDNEPNIEHIIIKNNIIKTKKELIVLGTGFLFGFITNYYVIHYGVFSLT